MDRNSEYDANEHLGGQAEEMKRQALRDKNHAYDQGVKDQKKAIRRKKIDLFNKCFLWLVTISSFLYFIYQIKPFF